MKKKKAGIWTLYHAVRWYSHSVAAADLFYANKKQTSTTTYNKNLKRSKFKDTDFSFE